MRFLHLNIRQRLPLYISTSAFLILLLEGYFIYAYTVRVCEQEFRGRLQERLIQADSMIAQDKLHPLTAINALPPGKLPDEKILYADDPRNIVMPNEKRLLVEVVDTTKLDRNTFYFTHFGQRDYGIRYDSVSHHTLVVSAIDLDGRSEIRNLRTGIILGILIGVLLLTMVSWYWVKKMLKPIADKIKKARAIGAQSLSLRLNVKNNYDELGELAVTFNEMLERIERGFRTQQQFIRNASHEMRTPLTAITAEVSLALQENRTPEKYRQILENVGKQAENLNELVTQLLLMASVERNGALNDQICAADEVLLATFRTLQHKYSEATRMIRLEIDAPDASLLLVRCDPAILQAAFFNVLDNAVKYGNQQPITVRLSLQNQTVHLEVTDQGHGIQPEELEHLFKPFYRSKQNSQIPGWGIGLSLVKSIVDKYGATVHLNSIPGKGTTVQIAFPMSDKI